MKKEKIKNKKAVRNSKKGMEMVQVGILIALAITIGLIFKTQITDFIDNTFSNLMSSGF